MAKSFDCRSNGQREQTWYTEALVVLVCLNRLTADCQPDLQDPRSRVPVGRHEAGKSGFSPALENPAPRVVDERRNLFGPCWPWRETRDFVYFPSNFQ